MATVARYFHDTLYSFEDERARNAVLEKFHSAISNAAVRCWYDHKRHEFQLECMNDMGDQADEALDQSISSYIKAELDAADQEGREPIIQRFVESQFNSLDTYNEEFEEPETQVAPARPRVTHLVMTGSSGNTLKLFQMAELPDRLLERAIVPRTAKAEKLFINGFTCRAARSQPTGGHVFHGRTGAGQESAPQGAEYIELAEFNALEDERGIPDTAPTAQPKTWVHVGRQPTMKDWLQGTGQVEQEDPNEQKEMPKDAVKFLATDDVQPVRGVRTRQVKGAQKVPDIDVEEYMKEDAGPPQKGRTSFTQLLAGEGDDESEASSSRSTRSLSVSSDGSKVPFNKIFGEQAKMPQRFPSNDRIESQPPNPVSPSAPLVTISNDSKPPNVLRVLSGTTAQTSTQPDPREKDNFPDYGQSFAKVDGIGLTANPSSIAEWQHKYHSLPKPKSKAPAVYSRGQVSRSRKVSENSASASNASSLASRARARIPTSGSSTSPSSRRGESYAADEAPNGNWANKIAPSQESGYRLVDTTASYSAFPPLIPPGMQQEKPRKPRSRVMVPTVMDGPAENLIDFSENVLEAADTGRRRVPPPLHFNSILSPTIANSPRTAASIARSSSSGHTVRQSDYPAGDDSDGEIVERLQKLPENFAEKRYTMRQKAGKKNKSKATSKPPAPKTALPLPDPVPPPRPRKPEPPPPPTGLQREKRQAKTAPQPAPAPVPSPATAPAPSDTTQNITDHSHAFGQQLQETLAGPKIRDDDSDDSEEDGIAELIPYMLIAQVGLLLTRISNKNDKVFSKTAYTPKTLQEKLNNELPNLTTEFIPRLTTSNADAKYLIDLGGKAGKSSSEACYEIFIRDSSKQILRLMIPVSAKHSFSLTTQNLVICEAFAHFPIHVWDARFLLRQPGENCDSPARKAVEEFVISMETDDLPPSFKAQVRSAAFSIERVLAKQSVNRDYDGLVYRVTKVQELACASLEGSSKHNFLATAALEVVMIEEQRLWWEASWETLDLSKAEEMKARVNEVVSNVDGVGLANQGPFEPEEEVGDAEVAPQGVTWYW